MCARSQEEWRTIGNQKWEEYWETRNHPHREEVLKELKKRTKTLNSVLEVGCASAPMLARIKEEYPKAKIYGFDISPTAIKHAKRNLPEGNFKVVDMLEARFPYKDNQFDLVITDAVLIYANDNVIENILREIKRVGNEFFLFVEWHNLKKDFVNDWYYVYDYGILLGELGFNDIWVEEIKNWEDDWKKYGRIITAKK